MISSSSAGFTQLAAHLIRQAERIAKAHAANSRLARNKDPRRWRKAGLIWPNFAGDR